jgi:ubiquinone biosynthesis protein
MRLGRLYNIIKTLLEYGIDELIPPSLKPWYFRYFRACFFWISNKHKHETSAMRLRLVLQRLGPVFIKFGQMLSTRRDLLPQQFADELAVLQDRVQPFDSRVAVAIIQKALGDNAIDDHFSFFDTKPLASASIAQVHAATLKEGNRDVVVKVLRPNVKHTIDADIRLMRLLASIAQKALPDGDRLRPVEVVDEYEKTILEELDLSREASNGVKLKQNFFDSDSLYIPHIYTDLCKKNVLVMERIYAISVSDVSALQAQHTNMKRLAEKGVEVFFTQVFRDSFFHADMHPGNIFVSKETPDEPKYIAIDFGIVGTLNSEDKRYLAENFIAFFNRDYRKVAQLHADSGWVPHDTNIDAFEVAIRTVCEPIFQKPLAEISFGTVLMQLFNTARQFNMVIQPQLVLLQKTLLYVEGLGRQLYPQLDLWKTAKPFLEQWLKQQISMTAMLKKVRTNFPFWLEKFPDVPDLLHDSLLQMKELPYKVEQQHVRQIDETKKLKKLVFSLITGLLSFMVCVGAGLVFHHVSFFFLGLIMAVLSWLMAFRYLR